MAIKNVRHYQQWREDPIGCMRPAVTCTGCDTHYPKSVDEGNAIYSGFSLIQCGKCQPTIEFHTEIIWRNGIAYGVTPSERDAHYESEEAEAHHDGLF